MDIGGGGAPGKTLTVLTSRPMGQRPKVVSVLNALQAVLEALRSVTEVLQSATNALQSATDALQDLSTPSSMYSCLMTAIAGCRNTC